ncbi:MAG: dTMP kinase [Sphingomonadales bacterium]|nr:dTMP kinase [Sphingomonadales bacterium]PIX66018.1 MAG: dTMP kinase [Sphingomonadales bacterium CG_4_10_14_3_um_filter_58_15]NCO50328.1 dTMP kinase [Sphingomonadales bacterium]NCP00309.1 dTMP kinase [Sphingomonadales bacterium]NCP26008.1 dTMP kinase [Sphingomonadales bacterium]
MIEGRFISLEGGEGTGKSTQAKALANALGKRGLAVCLTREPGGTPGAEIIRELLLTGGDDKWDLRTEALLFAAARAEHCAKLIRPALARGEWIICDRFVDSSRAYQSVSGELRDAEIMQLHQVGSKGLMPDRTFVLDLPETVASKRATARDRGDSDRIGSRDSDYHRAVMANFRQFAIDDPKRVRLIDARHSAEAITDKLFENIDDLLS